MHIFLLFKEITTTEHLYRIIVFRKICMHFFMYIGVITDINECEQEGVCHHGACNNFQGSFQCICDPGYVLTADRSSCIDLDECVRSPNICNNGTCLNSMGSYQCQCYRGFKIGPNRDCIGKLSTVFLSLCTTSSCRHSCQVEQPNYPTGCILYIICSLEFKK